MGKAEDEKREEALEAQLYSYLNMIPFATCYVQSVKEPLVLIGTCFENVH